MRRSRLFVVAVTVVGCLAACASDGASKEQATASKEPAALKVKPTVAAAPTADDAAPAADDAAPAPTVAPTEAAPPSTVTPTTAPPTTVATARAADTASEPSEATFSEAFTSEAGFTERFDRGWSGADPATWPDSAGPILSWQGDHDASCNGPTTSRTVNVANKDEVFWWCAPGGDTSKGHLMSAVNTAGYNIAWFSPKQWFEDVRRVCWDQNITDLGGGKWTQVVLVSEDEVAAFGGDLGVAGPGFQEDGGPTTGIIPSDLSTESGVGGAKMMLGGFEIWRGGEVTGAQDWWTIGGQVGTQGFPDKAARFTHCMEDHEDGTVTISQARPDGQTYTQDVAGDLPDGRVRVVFQDDNYDPDKHGGTSSPGDARYTWHWDNIEIS